LRDRSIFLDRLLRRTLRAVRRTDVAIENAMLELYEEDAHGRLGYRSFQELAEAQLACCSSTAQDRLMRARARRARDPIGVAYSRGEITRLQATLLIQLYRMHVPRSCVRRWIEDAKDLTIRELRDRLAWAREQVDEDYRQWVLAECQPPTGSQVRMSKRSLREIAENPNPEALDELVGRRDIPMTTLEWTVDKEIADHFYQMIASIQDKHLEESGTMLEPWMAALLMAHRARVAWSHLPKANRSKWERVYDRDHYRCAVPGCSRRRTLQDHHIVFRSKNGGDEHVNQITLCSIHHKMRHDNIIRITGVAEQGKDTLVFELGIDANGRALEVFHGDRRVRG